MTDLPPDDPIDVSASDLPPFSQAQPPTGSPSQIAPPNSASLAPPPPASGKQRPWWGMGDIALGVFFFLSFAILGTLIARSFGSSGDLASISNSSAVQGDLTVSLIAISLVFQQFGQGVWPFIVSRWKGLGAVADWRLRMKPADLGIGVGVAFIGLGAAALVNLIVTNLINLTDEASADNTQVLRDAQETPWFAVILLGVVIGAPVSEELFFRGLTLRAIEKRLGQVAAVVLSALIFTLPHFTGSDLKGTITLFSSIFVVGLVLGAAAVITDRIASSIIAHMVFNAIGAAGALGVFDSLGG